MTPWHHAPLVRLISAIIVGILVGILTGMALGLAVGLVAGWAAGAFWLSGWIIAVVWPMNPEQTKAHALREDPGRRTARVLSFVGSLASLVAVGAVLVQSHDPNGERTYVLAAIAVASVVASSLLIQTDYMLRYAVMYYTDPVGGIDFNEPDPPQYSDFAYFSVGLGMTYQVADTNVSTKELRKVVIAQTLIAYLFGSVILATVINLVSSLG